VLRSLEAAGHRETASDSTSARAGSRTTSST
jgi:hypothetical protein